MVHIDMPDFDRVKTMWDHFWAGDLYKRPLVVATVWDDARMKGRTIEWWYKAYQYALTGDYDTALEQIDLILECAEYMGEMVPFFSPDHGPDEFAAFLGTTLETSPESPNTSWAHPVVTDWNTFLPIKLHEESATWKSMITYSQKMVEHAKGRYVVSVADLHSHIDALSALRGPQQLCMDFYECPELIAEAMKQARALYPTIYETLYDAGNMKATGTAGWAPFWCAERYATIQADFICMASPEIAREFIIPAIEEEASYLDHNVYHFDGPGALIHLDDILAIKDIDVIQWVPGAGQPFQYEWLDVLKKCQKAGKKLQLDHINNNLEVVKMLHRELDPCGLVYCVGGTKREVLDIIEWLERNT